MPTVEKTEGIVLFDVLQSEILLVNSITSEKLLRAHSGFISSYFYSVSILVPYTDFAALRHKVKRFSSLLEFGQMLDVLSLILNES